MATQQRKLVQSILIGFGTAVAAQSAFAEEKEVTELGTIFIQSQSGAIPTDVIDQSTIEQRQPATFNELFSESPDVVVSGANRSAAQKVYVRGIEETMLNVSVDGARQGGNMYAHSGNFSVDPAMLKQVEVQPGSVSALNGPGALGGAIRYETKDAEDLLLSGQNHGAMLRFSAQTNGERISPALALYGSPDERFSYLVFGSGSWGSDYESGDGTVVNDTDSTPLDALVKLRFRPADGHEIEFSTTWRLDDGVRGDKSNFSFPTFPYPEVDQDLRWRSTSLRYAFNPAENPLIDLSILAYDTHSHLQHDLAVQRTADWYTRGIDVRNHSDFGQISLTYGFDYVWTQSRGRDATGSDVVETGRNQGLYVQGEYAPSEQWLLSAGLRYDRSEFTNLDGVEFNGDHLSPNLSARYMPLAGVEFYAAWGEAYRGVQPIEGMTLIGRHGADAANLTGEVSRTAELGFAFDRNGWRGGLNAFDTRIDGKILYWRGRRTPWYRDIGGDVVSRGYNIHLGRSWNNWSADLHYNHTDIEFNGEPVTPTDWLDGFTPGGDRVVLKLGYDMPSHGLKFGWTSTVVLDNKTLPSGYTPSTLPGYDVHDLFVTWQPAANQSYSIALTNIFDEQYLDQSTPYYASFGGSDLYEPGRSLRVSATIRF